MLVRIILTHDSSAYVNENTDLFVFVNLFVNSVMAKHAQSEAAFELFLNLKIPSIFQYEI